MPLPQSLHSYESEVAAFDRAKAAERGIRIRFETQAAASAYRARLHYARTLDRKENTRGIDPESPLYGKSDFDGIVATVHEDTEGGWWVYLRKNETIPGDVEEL